MFILETNITGVLRSVSRRFLSHGLRNTITSVAISMHIFTPGTSAEERWGYIDHKGNWAIRPRFKEALLYHQGLAAVVVHSSKTGMNENQTIDCNGRCAGTPLHLSATWELPRPVTYGDGMQMHYVLPNGKLAFNRKFLEAEPFSQNQTAFVKTSASQPFEIIDLAGKTIRKLDHSIKLLFGRSEGLSAFCTSTEHFHHNIGYIDESGKITISPQFSSARPFHERVAAVMLDNRWHYIDKRGRKLITLPISISNAGDFHKGLAPVAVGGIPCKIESNHPRPESHWGYIDRRGRLVVKPKFELDSDFHGHSGYFLYGADPPYFSEGLAAVSIALEHSHKFGFINEQGHLVIKPQFYHAKEFSEGLAPASIDVPNLSP